MKEIGLMTNNKDMVKKLGRMGLLMKENIKMAKRMEEGCLNGEMEICILENLKVIKWMDLEFIVGKVERFMTGNGKKIV